MGGKLGGGVGTAIAKYTPEGELAIYTTGFNAPDGLTFDNEQNLYVSNFGSGVINKITPEFVISVYASGLNNPSAMDFDAAGNLYVSNHGNGLGTTVSKITPAGVTSTFASGFDAPLGIVIDSVGNLYVSNYNSGIINKVSPEGVVTVFATISNVPKARLQYLIFDKKRNLYVPSYGHHRIYVISPEGEVSTFAGTGLVGGTDGPAKSARFDGPNSIAIDQSGNIYVSEYNANRIRRIEPINDQDGDGIDLLEDNCPDTFNPGQEDFDLDGIGDLCDVCTDMDQDGFGNPGFPQNTCSPDNCPETANPEQVDLNGDGIGDVCCCGFYSGGFAGNVDCSEDGKRNLADITRLIDRVYISKAELCCEENGNVDGDQDNKINLSDITRLIDHVYISKAETNSCL